MEKPGGLRTFLVQLREIARHKPPPRKPARVDREPKKRTPPATIAKELALDLAALAVFYFVLAALMSPILNKAGYAPGTDTPSHLYITKRLVDGLRHGRLADIDLLWYSGLEITHKLPPVTYIPLTLIYLAVNDAMSASRAFFLFALGLMGTSMYGAIRAVHCGRLNALGAALVVTFSTAALSPTFGVLSSFTRYTAFFFFPWALFSAKRLVDGRLAYLFLLAAIVSIQFPTHPMIALITALWVGVYGLARVVLEKKPLSFMAYFIYAYLLSAVLAFWYLGPFMVEEPVWGSSVPQTTLMVNSMAATAQLRHLGPVFGLLVITAVSLNFSRQRLALLAAAVFGFVYALGVWGPIITILPPLKFAYPFLSYFASVMGLTYLIFTSANLRDLAAAEFALLKQALATAIALLLVAAVVFQSYQYTKFTRFTTWRFTKDEIGVSRVLGRDKAPGRAMVLGPPYGLAIHALPLLAKRATPEGQYTTIAPFYLQITQLYDTIRKGFLESSVLKLEQWNTNFVLITPHLKQHRNFKKKTFNQVLRENGFKPIYRNGSFMLFKKTEPTQYLQKINGKVLAIGKFAPVVEALYPGSVAAQKSEFIDDYGLDELKNYRGLVLYGFSFKNQAKSERLLGAYVRRGGRLVVNMQAPDEYAFGRNKSFLGVNIGHQRMRGAGTVGLTDSRPVGFPVGWQMLYYKELDHVTTKGKLNGKNYAFIGSKKLLGKNVYFVGGDLFGYAFNKRRADLTALIDKTIAPRPEQSARPAKVRIERRRLTSNKTTFAYTSDRPWPVLISRTFSPHWRARLDGRSPIEVVKMDGLGSINLPPGKHRVTIEYLPTYIHKLSWSISVFAWLTVGYMFFAWRKAQWRPSAKTVPGGRPGPGTDEKRRAA